MLKSVDSSMFKSNVNVRIVDLGKFLNNSNAWSPYKSATEITYRLIFRIWSAYLYLFMSPLNEPLICPSMNRHHFTSNFKSDVISVTLTTLKLFLPPHLDSNKLVKICSNSFDAQKNSLTAINLSDNGALPEQLAKHFCNESYCDATINDFYDALAEYGDECWWLPALKWPHRVKFDPK